MTPTHSGRPRSSALSNLLVRRVALLSLLLSLTVGALNALYVWREETARQQRQLDSALAAYSSSIGKALWELDFDSARVQLQALQRFPAILSVDLSSAEQTLSYRKAGADLRQEVPTLRYPLLAPDGQREIGEWLIRLDRDRLHGNVWQESLRFIGLVTLELFILAGILLLLVQRTVAHPLRRLWEHVRELDAGSLDKPAPHPADAPRNELHELAEGITGLQAKLQEQLELQDSASRALAGQRDQLDRLLAGQTQRLDQVLAAMADGVAMLDRTGRLCFTNPAWQAMLGAQDGLPHDGWLLEPSWPALLAELESSHALTARTLTLRRRDGSVLQAEASLSRMPALTEDDSERFQLVARDIGARLETEQTLIAAREAAQNASLAKSAFLANMSHEIRTPLNAILGFAELLQDTALNERQQDYLMAVRTSGDALMALINDLLDFSKIEAGRLELERIDFDLRNVLESTLDLVAANARAKQLEVVCLVAPGVPPRLKGDPSRLRQVLLNLVNNAIKFTPTGSVVIRAAAETADGRSRIRLAVEDTGIGIPPDVQAQLFQPFVQADASTTRHFGGTGLGLSICRRLVEAMGGEIGVSSTPGHGACFRFSVLLEIAEAGTVQTPANIALQGLQALLLSPLAATRELIEQSLGELGMHTRSADTVGAGLAQLAGTEPCAVALIDQALGETAIDGLPARLHALPGRERLPLILLSQNAQPGEASEARNAGFAAFMSKPLHPSLLPACIAEALRVQALPRSERPLITSHHVAEQRAAEKPLVLLAEDNPVNQKIAVLMLEKLGMRVEVAENGRAAVDAVRSHDYALVLMDCQMPEMDGFAATAAIRQLADGKAAVPIVALTANAMQEDQQRCRAAGMNDFVAKPVKLQALEEALRQWLPQPVTAAPPAAV